MVDQTLGSFRVFPDQIISTVVVLHYQAKHVLYLQGILDISKSIIKDLNIQKMYKSGFTVVRIRSFMKLLTNQKGKYL